MGVIELVIMIESRNKQQGSRGTKIYKWNEVTKVRSKIPVIFTRHMQHHTLLYSEQ